TGPRRLSFRTFPGMSIMGDCTRGRGQLWGRLLLAFLLAAFTSTVFFATPRCAVAQEGDNQPAPDKEEDVHKSKMSGNPIVHFFVSIGVVFGIIFAALSVGT